MPRCVLAVVAMLAVAIRAIPLPFVAGFASRWQRAWPAMAPTKAPGRIAVVRDAETEALLRKFADPLFRAASHDSRQVRSILVRDRAIDGFARSGNRRFVGLGRIRQNRCALPAAVRRPGGRTIPGALDISNAVRKENR